MSSHSFTCGQNGDRARGRCEAEAYRSQLTLCESKTTVGMATSITGVFISAGTYGPDDIGMKLAIEE